MMTIFCVAVVFCTHGCYGYEQDASLVSIFLYPFTFLLSLSNLSAFTVVAIQAVTRTNCEDRSMARAKKRKARGNTILDMSCRNHDKLRS
jgi:hypothetical protein